MMPLFEPPAHMMALGLEVMSAPEFSEHPFLCTHTVRGAMTDGELHVRMQF